MKDRAMEKVIPMQSAEPEVFVDITQHEIQALKTRFNLADAHTHQRQSPSQRAILARLHELWYEAEETTQAECEQRFIHAFFELEKQPTALTKRPLLSYAASISMLVAATYLRHKRHTVSLIEPCFDNLHDIMKNMEIPMQPLPEQTLHEPGTIYDRLRETVTASALFLVDPNNPTGFTLLKYGRRGFEEVARFCRDHGKLLLLDLSFASFALMDGSVGRFDIYELLESYGVSYIVIEDTGKTWPVQDAKCAILVASDDIYNDVYNIHTSVLLNVSPFVLKMLTEYLRDSQGDGFASIRNVLERNRSVAQRVLAGSVLEYCQPATRVSVGWFRIQRPDVTGTMLQRDLGGSGVYILPGKYFFWHQPAQGERFVRVALARDPGLFESAINKLREGLVRYERD